MGLVTRVPGVTLGICEVAETSVWVHGDGVMLSHYYQHWLLPVVS